VLDGGVTNGINTTGNGAVINNDGVIAGANHAIENNGTVSAITNNGTITGVIDGIHHGALGSIINNGTISGGIDAIDANSIANLVNTDTISGDKNGVSSNGAVTSPTNSGMIVGHSGDGVRGLWIISLTNSGSIFSPLGGAHAIIETGVQDTLLTLNAGSIIQGRIDLGGGTNTLNVGEGLNLASTFETTAPVIGDMSGSPFAVQGNLVAVVDPDSVAAMASTESIADIAGGISGAVNQRQSEAARIPGANYDIFFEDTWVKAIGGYRLHQQNRNQHMFGGFVAGADGMASDDLRLGLFGGVSFGAASASTSGEVKTANFYAGTYGSFNNYLDFGLTAGLSHHAGTRCVANNLVAGGLETARADFNGYFVSPEVTLKAPAAMMGNTNVKPSARIRYTYMHTPGYVETGTVAPLTINGRNDHVLDGRLQLAFEVDETSDSLLEARVGIDGRVASGGHIDGTLLGQAVSFGSDAAKSSVSGFAGVHYTKQLKENTSLFLTAEIGSGTDVTFRADAQAGLNVKF
jgi:hypothetical protein